MDKNRQYKIAMVIRTNGLEFDDRIRKEILTIQELFPNVKFKIFPMFDDNRSEEGLSSYGVPYKSVHSPARDKYAQRTHLIRKSIDFYRSVKNDLKGFDAVWCGDFHTFMVAALCGNKNLLWDLHELPSMLLGNPLKQMFLRYIFHRCKCVVHANPQRIEYLKSRGAVTEPSKHFALRNYPNFEDVDTEYDDKYSSFVEWRGGRKCVYLQGLNDDSRAAYESVKAVLSFPDFTAVVVGRFDDDSKTRLEGEYGDELDKRIMFVGKIAQMKIPQYVKECFTTLVFYKNVRPNNLYCEANRFYQSVIMGLPVVVGNNPSMKELIDKYSFGISIDDDGHDIEKIIKGLEEVIEHYEELRINNEKYKDNLLWDSQNDTMIKIVEKFLI